MILSPKPTSSGAGGSTIIIMALPGRSAANMKKRNSSWEGHGINMTMPGIMERSSGLNMRRNTNRDDTYYDNTGFKTDFNIFLKAGWSPVKDLTLYGDMQYRHIIYTDAWN